jgi:hypothetical protein
VDAAASIPSKICMQRGYLSHGRQAVQVKATETAKSLGITNFKAGEDCCHRFICQNIGVIVMLCKAVHNCW